MTNLGITIVLLFLFGLACGLAYKAGYQAGVEAKWLRVDAEWEEKK